MKGRLRAEADGCEREAALLRVYPALLAFFRHHLPAARRQEAEDFAQEVLLVGWAALAKDGLLAVRDPVQYVLGIARHKCADQARKRTLEEGLPQAETEDTRFKQRLVGAAAERTLLEEEARRSLQRALARLPGPEREFIRFRFFEGMGNDEASRRLGLRPDEGSRVKYRALKSLRAILEREKLWRNRFFHRQAY